MIHETGYWNSQQAPQHHIHSPKLSEFICEYLKHDKERQLYDFGCGMGNYLKHLYANGFKNVNGIEPDAPDKSITDFTILNFDLTNDVFLTPKGNIICLEVGEHIPPQYTHKFLQNIKENCENYLIMSWAVRGQGGVGHFNELNNDEVIPIIQNLGFEYLANDSELARQNVEDFCAYFRNTLMIFKKV